jgi:hypothetical protein
MPCARASSGMNALGGAVMSAQPYSPDDTAPRLLAYLASMRALRGADMSEDEAYIRGRALIEAMAMSASGDEPPRVRMSAEQCADILHFIYHSEPRKPGGWWKDPAEGPSHVVGFVYVIDAVERNLRGWSGRPVKLSGLTLADRYRWTEPSRRPVALPDR